MTLPRVLHSTIAVEANRIQYVIHMMCSSDFVVLMQLREAYAGYTNATAFLNMKTTRYNGT